MRVLYHIPYQDGLGADRWIYEGWREGFLTLGHEFDTLSEGDVLSRKARERKPDLFFTAVNIINLEDEETREVLGSLREKGAKILLWVHWPLEAGINPRRGDVLKRDDVADVYFGERESEQMAVFESETGKKYHVIPHAANPRYHFPSSSVPKYQCDIVYLGANLKRKRWFTENVLMPLSRKYKVGIFGPGWTAGDNLLRACSKACRVTGLPRVAKFIDQHRIGVPLTEENQLYSSSKISLNFHEREDDGSQPHYIVNQRTFKIPACGGFQICDYVPAIRKYFREDELVMAEVDQKDWLEKIGYFLSNEGERKRIQVRGTRRAVSEHMYTHRVAEVLRLLQFV